MEWLVYNNLGFHEKSKYWVDCANLFLLDCANLFEKTLKLGKTHLFKKSILKGMRQGRQG